MANTSRKRPPPRSAPPSTANGAAVVPSAPPSSHAPSVVVPPGPLPSGIDALLAKYAQHLPPGGSVTVRLIKGPTSESVDPIAARQAARKAARARAAASSDGGGEGASSGNDSDGRDNGGAPAGGGATNSRDIAGGLKFPRIAKFIETVDAPDFYKGGLKDGRMYEEEVPKAKDESDEEESTAYKPSNVDPSGEGGAADLNNPQMAEPAKNKKKKRRWRRNDPRPRRWVLQEKEEFFDRIRKRRQRASGGGGADEDEGQVISNRYHGVAESNASRYVVLGVAPTLNNDHTSASPSSKVAMEQISVQPIAGFHAFSQPQKLASLTMEEAEEAIEKQRNVVTRYMMHGKLASQNNSEETKAALATGVAGTGRGRGRPGRGIGPAPKAMSRARLLGKLAGGGGSGRGDEDDDDVMGDVRFSSSRGGGGGSSRARKELLGSMGDDGVTADGDGVLGGANDGEFGGRRRFARVAADKDDGDAPGKGGGKGGDKAGGASTGFEAGAMEDGFYQRDVAAEYEALDYDANEQFDDDDVNVGEDEMADGGGGFADGDNYESDDDNALDSEDDLEGSDDDDFRGMASSSGMRAMLARARGDSPATTAGADANAAGPEGSDASPKGPDSAEAASSSDKGGKAIDKMKDAMKKTAEEMEKKKLDSAAGTIATSAGDETTSPEKTMGGASSASNSPKTAAEIKAMGIEKDKDGKRLITLEAVRREIWLHNGAITSKRLTKKFDVNKKNPERQALFKTIVMELCTIKKDADGNKLVLKQHYSKK